MSTVFDFETWVQERDAAFLSLKAKRICAYCRKYRVPIPEDRDVFWIGVHKTRTALTNLPMSARSKSKNWLAIRGFKACDGGDVPFAEVRA